MKVINKARIDFKYKASLTSPIISKTISSNIVDTIIIKDRLYVEHSINKKNVCLCDTLLYKIIIKNIFHEKLLNIEIREVLPVGIKFIYDSVLVNHIKYKCCDITQGCKINALKAGEKLIITFKCKVTSLELRILKNYCKVFFDYVYNIEQPPLRIYVKSNYSILMGPNNILKKIKWSTNFIIPDTYNIKIQLKKLDVKVKIIDKKIIINSIDKNKISIIVIGNITYSMCGCVKTEGFSEVFALSRDIACIDKMSIEMFIEDVFCIYKNRYSLFISVPILIFILVSKCKKNELGCCIN